MRYSGKASADNLKNAEVGNNEHKIDPATCGAEGCHFRLQSSMGQYGEVQDGLVERVQAGSVEKRVVEASRKVRKPKSS